MPYFAKIGAARSWFFRVSARVKVTTVAPGGTTAAGLVVSGPPTGAFAPGSEEFGVQAARRCP